MSSKSESASPVRMVAIIAAAIALIVSSILPQVARAQGPEAVAAGAAVAGVVIEAIGGLATWIGNQSDDCYVAALGAAWGKDCNLNKEECTDTGYSYASCSATGDNGCAHGYGQGFASEGALGSWSSCEIKPYASAWTKSLHLTDDKHNGRGWGKAGVDGTSKCSEEVTPDASRRLSPFAAPVGLKATTLPITIVAHIKVDTLTLSARAAGFSQARVNLSVKIDGGLVWSGSANLDQTGAVSLGGALAGVPYVSWLDPATGRWEARILGYNVDYVVGTFGGTASPGLQAAAERDVHVELDGDTEANAEASNAGGIPTYVTVSTPSLHAVDALGEPVLKSQRVQILTPLTVMYAPSLFGVAMTDLQLFDPQSGLSVGVLDFERYPQFVPGTRVMVRGTVTHHEGRTVLCDTEIQPVGQNGPLPPAIPMPIAALLGNAEQREGSLVTINGAQIVGGAWPLPGEGALLQVTDPSGALIDLEIDADTDIDGSLPPVGPFQLVGFLGQYDPNGQQEPPSERGGLVTKAGGPGYFEGYRIRPRWSADIIGSTAGAGEPVRPTGNRAFELQQNQPNPFNPVTQISFRLHQAGPARLRIFSIDGRLVRTLLDGSLAAGEQMTAWDGRDDGGRALPSGLYLYAFEAEGQRETRKMLMTK